jgi:hypothetical protein
MLTTPIIVDVKLVFNVLLVIIDFDDALDFEYTDQHVLKEPDLDLLLDNDEQLCRNPNLGFATKAKAYEVTGQEGSPGVTFSCSRECKRM